MAERIHKRACLVCGGDMTEGQLRRQAWWDENDRKIDEELDSTYRHLRAVIENCKTMDAAAIRHQLVGLLPEVQDPDPDLAKRLREKGMGHLTDRAEQLAQDGWAEYGYGSSASDLEGEA